MRIRPGLVSDHPGVLAVYRLARAVPPTRARLARVAVKLAEELLVVAEDEAGVVGFALGELERGDRWAGGPEGLGMHVSMVFVAPARQREGIGTALLEGLADRGWAQDFRTVSAWTATPAFYEACGLERTGETRTLPDGRTAVRLEAELEPPAREVVLDRLDIRLGQLLKFAGIVDTGAEAKALLAAGEVEVNGEVEVRRGRQLADGDQIRASGHTVVVRLPIPDRPRAVVASPTSRDEIRGPRR